MGLIVSMRPASGASAPYDWRGGPHSFEVTVSVGRSPIASSEFVRRWLAPGIAAHDESIAATGFDAQFWMPPAGGSRRPAVLEFGGSEGGLHGQLIGAALAAAGYPTLDIAYFGVPGLPPRAADSRRRRSIRFARRGEERERSRGPETVFPLHFAASGTSEHSCDVPAAVVVVAHRCMQVGWPATGVGGRVPPDRSESGLR
jgi:hypothetical protein